MKVTSPLHTCFKRAHSTALAASALLAIVFLPGCFQDPPKEAQNAPATNAAPEEIIAPEVTRIGLFSGADASKPQPIWDSVTSFPTNTPGSIIWVGNIVPAGLTDGAMKVAAFQAQRALPGYSKLISNTNLVVMGTFGLNEATVPPAPAGTKKALKGKPGAPATVEAERPGIPESRNAFFDFLGGAHAELKERSGAYSCWTLNTETDTAEGAITIAQLDTFSHAATPSPKADLLGEDQWSWLEERLSEEAQSVVTLVVSGIPYTATADKGALSWDSYPAAKERLFKLLSDYGTTGLILVSPGSAKPEFVTLPKAVNQVGYDLTEIRVGPISPASADLTSSVGLISIEWEADPMIARIQFKDASGNVTAEKVLNIDDLVSE